MSQSPVSQSPVLRSQAVVSVVCTRSQPYPALGGAPLRNLQTLEALKRLGPVSLFSLYKGRHDPDAYGGLANWEHCDLNLAQRSFGDRLGQRLRWLRPDGYYYTDWMYTAQNADQLRRFLARLRPQVIVFEELWLCPYLAVAIAHRQAHPGCQIILDNHNVEGLLAPERRDLISARTWADRIGLALRPQRVRRLERRALAQVDQMWVCSDADRQALVSLYGIGPREPDGQKLRVVPNGVEVAAYKADLGRASGSSLETARSPQQQPELPLAEPKLLFLGSFGYGPNAEAAQILIEHIYPRLRQRHPTTQLWLVGSEPTQQMQRAAQQDNQILVTGQVDSVLPYLQAADVMVVPLRHGSGTRLKLLEAFAAGLPVVSTTKGAEGLAVVDGRELLIRDGVDALVAGVEQLWVAPDWGEALRAAALALVRSHYSWESATEKIAQSIGLERSSAAETPTETLAETPTEMLAETPTEMLAEIP